MKPIIGVTGYYHPYSREVSGVFVGEDYTGAISSAGGIPVVIPFLESEEDVKAMAAKLDGLLLSGGFDMDPQMFGEQPIPGMGEVTPERDWLESILFREMHLSGKPIFGICRGMQIMNIMMGGNVYQDLPSQKEGELLQHSQRAPRWYGAHTVTVTEGTLLHAVFGQTRIRTNSFHHQAVRDVPDSLLVSAVADDGVIEAIEAKEGAFLVGVQWHPENMWRREPRVLKLFEAFVDAARND